MKEPKHYFQIVQKDIGHVYFEIKNDYAHLYDLYIQPDKRNQGHARELLLHAIRLIKEEGWNDEIQIVCAPTEEGIDKERLSNFYESLGLIVYSQYYEQTNNS